MCEPLCLSRLCELELRAEQTAAQRKHGAEPPFTLPVGEALSLIAQARRCAEAERLLDSRAGKLLKKGKYFVVVACDEPYFNDVYACVRSCEQAKGTWTREDEAFYVQHTGHTGIVERQQRLSRGDRAWDERVEFSECLLGHAKQAERELRQRERADEAERCAKRLWLHEWVDDRIFLRSESCEFDLGRALRLVRRVPAPVDLDADMTFTDGQPGLHDDAAQRLRGFVDELVDLLTKKPVLSRHAREREEVPTDGKPK